MTLKYGEKQYKLYDIAEWSITVQDPKDQIKKVTERHPILKDYLNKQRENREYKNRRKLKHQYDALYLECPELRTTSEEEMDCDPLLLARCIAVGESHLCFRTEQARRCP